MSDRVIDAADKANLVLYTSPDHISLARLSAISKTTLRQWNGGNRPSPVEFCLALDPLSIHLFAQVDYPPDFVAGDKYSFVSGLWEKDVLELFLAEDGTDRYQEINLSPAGAWWSAVFWKYREMEAEVNKRPAEIMARAEPGGWKAGISLLRKDLGVSVFFGPQSKAAVYAILGASPRMYCSAVSPGGKPDFHRKDAFTGFTRRRLGA